VTVASANKSIETRGTAMKTVSPAQDRTGTEEIETAELAFPSSVLAALGELVNAAKDGLLALSVGVGLGVLQELMRRRSTMSSGRTVGTIPTGQRSVTATKGERSRSAVAA
jgi:hypothetical protein